MARVGGRNTSFAWVIGVLCAAVIGAMVWIAAPMVPQAAVFLGDYFAAPTSAPVAGDDEQQGPPGECRDLYDDELWQSLVRADDALLTPSTDAPLTVAAGGLVDALTPHVQLTCTWTSAEGTLSTTLATVPTDAGSIARSALPALGFECGAVAERIRCVLDGDGRGETIDMAGDVWLSTVQDGWHPSGYVDAVAARVWQE
jgi:hypothetical protein